MLSSTNDHTPASFAHGKQPLLKLPGQNSDHNLRVVHKHSIERFLESGARAIVQFPQQCALWEAGATEGFSAKAGCSMLSCISAQQASVQTETCLNRVKFGDIIAVLNSCFDHVVLVSGPQEAYSIHLDSA